MSKDDKYAVTVADDVTKFGLAMANALILSDVWCHRRIESLSLMEGARGRRNVSIDCSPTSVLWNYESPDGDSVSQLLVPLAFMAKVPIRDLDVVDRGGEPVPILGTDANAKVGAAVLASIIGVFGDVDITKDRLGVLSLISTVVKETPTNAQRAASRLFRIVKLPPFARNIVEDFAHNFLLIGVLDKTLAGQRQVIKYSYHWEGETLSLERKTARNLLLAGFGIEEYHLEVDAQNLQFAKSYHFECPAPPGLVITQVRLPIDSTGIAPTDRSRGTMGHANGRYSDSFSGGAPVRVRLELDSSGILPRVVFGSLAVLTFFIAAIVANLYELLSGTVDAATAMLLTVPALLLGLDSRQTENRVVSGLLWPLRLSSLLLAISLFGFSLVLVLGLGWEIGAIYSAFGVLLSLTIFSVASSGYRRLRSAERGMVRS